MRYVIADIVPSTTANLTPGKPYEFDGCETEGRITADNGDSCFILLENCSHLAGLNWRLFQEIKNAA